MDFASLDFPPTLRELLEEPLPPDAYIPIRKITQYLLVPQPKDDKSAYLARAGFGASNPQALMTALWETCANADAEPIGEDCFGHKYQVVGVLRGPNGRNLWIKMIWKKDPLSGITRLITLTPFPPPLSR
ncbi:MAG TPA: hypothetical protein VHV47_08470 [Opitutaceae bacterium]|jgi:hypothetical protein|nr:hypothetical protein [Opitutaceae bacterium]